MVIFGKTVGNIVEKTEMREVGIFADPNFSFILVITAADNLVLPTGRTETGLKLETGWTTLQV